MLPVSLLSSGAQLSVTVFNGSTSSSSTSTSTVVVSNPVPAVASLMPTSVVVGSTSATVGLNGSGFVPATTLTINGFPHPVTFVSSSLLNLPLTSADLASTAALNLVTANPAPGGGSSASVPLSIINPPPALTTLTPSSVAAGGSDFTLDVAGNGFVSSSSAFWNGSALPTTFVSSTELKVAVPAPLIASSGTARVTVVTPAPGGGQSVDARVAVQAPVPVLNGVSPRAVPLNQPATVKLTGTGFVLNSVAQWNGSTRPTTFGSATQVTVALTAADLGSSGNGQLAIVTPAPGGGSSTALPLTVTNQPIPTISDVALSVTSVQGCSQIQFTATGTNLLSGGYTSFQVNGATVRTAGSSSNQTGTLPLGFSAAPGQMTFTASLLGSSIVSDPFTVPASSPPLLALCAVPGGATVYPASNFLATFFASEVNSAASAVISGITLPSGVTVPAALPFPVAASGTRTLFSASSSLPAGGLSLLFTGSAGGMTASGTLSLNVSSATPPTFFFPSGLANELGVPIGGSGSLSFSSIANGSSLTDYTIALSISGLPAGTTATVTPDRITPGESFKVTVTAAGDAPVTQNATVTITGTPEAAVAPAHLVFLVDVTPGPGGLANNRSDFVSTAATPYAMIYDRAQDLIYASNPTWNRIDIVSNQSRKLVRSIPLRGPRSLDLSLDGSTLWIGTDSQQVFAMDTAGLTMTRYLLPALSGSFSGGQTYGIAWQDLSLSALSDGTLLMTVSEGPGSGSQDTIIWTPGSSTLTRLNTAYTFSLKSGDGRKVYGTTVDSVNCHAIVYDTATRAITTLPNTNERCSLDAVNNDGTRLIGSDNGVYGLYNGANQFIGKLPTSALGGGGYFTRGSVFSHDGTTLYQIASSNGARIFTIDVASLTLKGTAPAIETTPNLVSQTPDLTQVRDVDDSGILIGLQDFGIGFDDSTFFQTYAATTGGQTVPVTLSPNAGPLSGGTASSPYGIFSLTPDVWYGANRGTATVDGTNSLRITSPAGAAPGPVNLKYIYPDGDEVFTPEAFSYSTYPQYAILAGGSPNGGVPGRISGYGMPADASGGALTIGGAPAAITTKVTQYPPYTSEPFPSTYLDFTLPPGSPGFADLQLTTPIGTGTLARSIFYAKSVKDHASSDTFTDILYDSGRKQVYLAAGDHVDVFSTAANQFVTPLKPATMGGSSTFRGLALTPDGTQLLAANMTDGSLGVINPDTPSQTFAIPITPASGTGTTCASGAFSVAALANHRAFVSTGLPTGVGGCPANNNKLYLVDLQARTAAAYVASTGCSFFPSDPGEIEATADGSRAIIANLGATACFYTAATATMSPGPSGALAYFGATVAADGNIAAVGNTFSDSTGNGLGGLGRPNAFFGTPAIYPTNNYPANTLQRPRLNASGSLYFWAYPSYFEIFDVPTGTLRLRFSLSEKVQSVETPMAIDDGGRQVFLITDAGLTAVDLGSAPLSIGHVNPAAGPGGTQLLVRGSGFSEGIKATIGGQPAAVSVVDENTLTVTVPMTLASGPKDLTLVSVDGTTYTLHSGVLVP